MSVDTIQALKGRLEWPDLFATIKYKIDFKKQHPDYFYPDGILVFTGPQGSGKTLSGVQYVKNLMEEYPKAILCSNVEIKGYGDRFVFFDSVKLLKSLRNGEYGVIFFIDEIQLLFNSLESKNTGIELFVTICQQRKQRIHIVGTSQLFTRISKPFREQFKYACMCTKVLGVLQYNKIVRGDECDVDDNGKVVTGKVWRSFFFHSPRLYDSYDTYATIDRVNFDFNWDDFSNKEVKENESVGIGTSTTISSFSF